MPILKTLTMPNRGIAEYHFVRRYEMSFLDNTTLATILSYPNEDAFISGVGAMWSTPVGVPIDVASQEGNVLTNLENWLVTDASEFPFLNGNIIEDVSQSFSTLRSRAWDKVKVKRSFYEYNGFQTPLGRFDSDEESMRRIAASTTAAMVAKTNGTEFSVEWTMSDNSMVTLDADKMLSVGVAAVKHVTDIHDFARQLRVQIELAMTTDDLLVIENAIWPAVIVT